MTQRLTLTVDEAGKMIGVCRNTAYKLVHNGEIPSIRIGRRLLVPADFLKNLSSYEKPKNQPDPIWPEFVW